MPHGIPKPREEWTVGDEDEFEQRGYVIWSDWEWVGDVLDTAMIDIYHEQNNLKGVVFGGTSR